MALPNFKKTTIYDTTLPYVTIQFTIKNNNINNKA